MKSSVIIITVAEWILITVISVCAILCLTPSNFYIGLHDILAKNHATLAEYLPLIIWFVIFEIGIMTVFVWKKGGGLVFLLAVLAALPSIAAFNSLDLLKIFGVESTIATKLSFWETLLLGAVLIICYILINSMNVLKLARIGLINRKASPDDIEQVNEFSHLFTLLATVVSMVVVVIICGIAWSLESLISSSLPQVWYIVPVGLGCVIVLGVYIYWVGTGRQGEKKTNKDELEARSLKPGANNE